MRKYTVQDLIDSYLNRNQSWAKEIDEYTTHLVEVLEKAYQINMTELCEQYPLLAKCEKVYQQLKTPLSGAVDATLALNKLPVLEDISTSHSQQKEIIEDMYNKVIEYEYPLTTGKRFSKKALHTFGYNTELEPDYGKLYDDYY